MAKQAGEAFRVALRGGKHAGMLNTYVEKPADELRRALRSFQRRIAEHERWISDPTEKIRDFETLDPRQQEHLIMSKWPEDIRRLQEQKAIIEGLLKARQNDG